MAASVTSKSLIVGIEQTASTWGTPVAVGANDLVLVNGLGPLLPPAEIVPDPSAGYAWHKYIEKCRENVTPEITMPMRYSGRLWSPVAQCMGLDTKTGSEDPYTHVFSLLEAINGSDLFSTIVAQLGPSGSEMLFEWPSATPTGFTIDGPDGDGYMSLSVGFIADTVNLGADCTNTTSDIDNLTHMEISSALPGVIPFGSLSFRLNSHAGGALAGGDALKIRHFTFSFKRGFGPEWTARGALAQAWQSDEPVEEGIPEMSLMIELGDLNDLTHLEYYDDETALKCDATWTLSGDHYVKLEIPKMFPAVPDANAEGASRIPQTLNYMVMEALSNPTGMSFNLPQLTVSDPNDTAYE